MTHWQLPIVSQNGTSHVSGCSYSEYICPRSVCLRGPCFPTSLGSSLSLVCGNVILLPLHDIVWFWLPLSVSAKSHLQGSAWETFPRQKTGVCQSAVSLCLYSVLKSLDNQWRSTSVSVKMYIEIDGKVKSAWHLNYLVKHPSVHWGFYIVQLFFFNLSLIIYSLCGSW